MSTGDVLAVVAATIVTVLVAVLATVLVLLTRTLRELRAALTILEEDALALLDDADAAAFGEVAVLYAGELELKNAMVMPPLLQDAN